MRGNRLVSDAQDQQISRLTERQKQCLVLFGQGRTAKEIGRALGISDSTVNNHLHSAAQLLGANGGKEAARLYEKLCVGEPRQKLPSESPQLAAAAIEPDQEPSTRPSGWGRLRSLLPPIGGSENALTPSETVSAIARISFFGALAFIACVMIVKMAFQVLN